MSNLKIHYQVTNTELTNESGFTANDFIFKMATSIPFQLENGDLAVNCEYRVYKSAADMAAGLKPFKLMNNGERVVNISNFSLAPWGNVFGTDNYTAVEKQMIKDTFGVLLGNLTVVNDPV